MKKISKSSNEKKLKTVGTKAAKAEKTVIEINGVINGVRLSLHFLKIC